LHVKRCKRSSKLEDVPVDGQEIEEKKRDLVEVREGRITDLRF